MRQLRNFLVATSCAAFSVHTQEPLPLKSSSEEALFVRRILEFWRDKESGIVKTQIKEFIAQYPSSEFVDSLLVILGDINWSEHNYNDALAAYRKISSAPLQEKVYNNHLDSLYHLKNFAELAEMVKGRVLQKEPKTAEEHLWIFYYAEAKLQQARVNTDQQAAKEDYTSALPTFEKLMNTAYDTQARFSLAEIHLALEHYAEASTLYIELADTYPEKQEKLLFQAGQLQGRIDPFKALEIFGKIERLQGPRAHEAALQRARILFEEKQYRDVIAERESMQTALKEYQLDQWNEYLGRSYFAVEEYGEALTVLTPLLPKCDHRLRENPKNKTILLSLILSAYHQNELPPLENWTSRFEKNFPHDPMLPQVLYMQAMAYLQTDHFDESQLLFSKLLNAYPDLDKREVVLFENSRLLAHQERWSDARQGFLLFAQEYPQSSKRGLALQQIANASSHILESAEKRGEATARVREMLIGDLLLVLNSPESIKSIQKPKYLYCLAKTHYELKQFPEALAVLKTYSEQYPSDPLLYQAHLLTALCYQELQEPQKFAFHAERVLALNPDLPDQQQLRLSLFTTYLQLSQKVHEIEAALPGSQHHTPYVDIAAEHLYRAAISNSIPIKPENLLWLANHYYGKVKEKNDEYMIGPLDDAQQIEFAERSASLFQKALVKEENQPVDLHPENLRLEHEFFKWSHLYGWLGIPEQQILLLNNQLAQYDKNPDWKWSLRSRAKFSLANALYATGELAQALELYSQLMQIKKGADPFITTASKLQFARLSFDLIPEPERNLDNPRIITILKNLKDIQIRKNIAHEPLHLEAALDYAKIRASLEPPKNQEYQLSFLLMRSKEDFNRIDDIASKDYAEAKNRDPGKDLIFQAYIRLMDAHIAYAQALHAKEEGNREEWDKLRENARGLYQSLLTGKLAVSKYVINEAQSCLGKL
jgi:TolA-binding protein